MASLVSRLFIRKQITQAPVKKIMVAEKNNLLQNSALNIGGGIIKTGAVVTGLGVVGMEAQKFKNKLFDDILSGDSSLGNLSDGIKDKLSEAKNDIITGVVIIASFIGIGLIIKSSMK